MAEAVEEEAGAFAFAARLRSAVLGGEAAPHSSVGTESRSHNKCMKTILSSLDPEAAALKLVVSLSRRQREPAH